MSRRRQKMRQQAYWSEQPGLFDKTHGDSNDATMPALPTEFDGSERLRFISFGSGSSGNCAYIGTPSCGFLIDAGVNNNTVVEQLAANAIDISTIRGILLTHDHFDHMQFAYALLRRNMHMRLYATPKMLNGLLRRHNTSRRIADYHQPVYKEFPFSVGPFTVTPFETSHDGSDNVGYCIEGLGTSFTVVTDTGIITPRADFYLRQSSFVMIESDYDAEMLRTGPYGAHLKARISSDTGHLDNADTAKYLASIAPLGVLRRAFLCHLSHINNTPEKALETMTTILGEAGVDVSTEALPSCVDTRLHIMPLPRAESSPLIFLTESK